MERIFFALLPPPQLASQIAAWAPNALASEWVMQRADRLHITLAIIDDGDRCSGALVDRLLRAGTLVAAAPLDVSLDRLACSTRSAALRLSRINPGLQALHKAIAGAMTHVGAPLRQDWRFSPHMTLGYGDGRPAQQGAPARQWRAGEFVLIRSLVGRTRHLRLGRWPLGAAPPRQYALF